VVNGNTWPDFQVTPQRYRLRLLNGSDARTYNLSLWIVPPKKGAPARNAYTLNSQQLIDREKFVEMPVYQIGADQGFLPKVVKVQTGCSVQLAGDGSIPQCPTLQPDDPNLCRALLVAPAERADVILDFSALPVGTVVRMVNTGPDEPFGGLPSEQSDKDTTGQVMSFTVVAADAGITDPSTPVKNLVMPTDIPIAAASNTRTLSLNEAESEQICVKVNAVNEQIEKVVLTLPTPAAPGTIADICAQVNAVPFEPRETLLGTLPGGTPAPQHWADPITQTPALDSTEEWELYNYTDDAHPIHVHLVRFKIINREGLVMDPLTGVPVIPATPDGNPRPPEATEMGYKDTVVALPGEVTRVQALFDIKGLYVWHCHILEHEDNEMMLPYCVGGKSGQNCPGSTVPVM
jgi:spore coat protein A